MNWKEVILDVDNSYYLPCHVVGLLIRQLHIKTAFVKIPELFDRSFIGNRQHSSQLLLLFALSVVQTQLRVSKENRPVTGIGQAFVLKRLEANIDDGYASLLELGDRRLQIRVRATDYRRLDNLVAGFGDGVHGQPNINTLLLENQHWLAHAILDVIAPHGTSDDRLEAFLFELGFEQALVLDQLLRLLDRIWVAPDLGSIKPSLINLQITQGSVEEALEVELQRVKLFVAIAKESLACKLEKVLTINIENGLRYISGITKTPPDHKGWAGRLSSSLYQKSWLRSSFEPTRRRSEDASSFALLDPTGHSWNRKGAAM